jgi:hypothetical protein
MDSLKLEDIVASFLSVANAKKTSYLLSSCLHACSLSFGQARLTTFALIWTAPIGFDWTAPWSLAGKAEHLSEPHSAVLSATALASAVEPVFETLNLNEVGDPREFGPSLRRRRARFRSLPPKSYSLRKFHATRPAAVEHTDSIQSNRKSWQCRHRTTDSSNGRWRRLEHRSPVCG